LQNSIGVAKNEGEAAKLYRLSADQGHRGAQFNYGCCLQAGIGVAKNEREAVRYYRLSADQGDSDAQNNYGRCLQNGLGIAVNELSADQINNFGRNNSRLCLPKEIWHRKNGKESVEYS
jgi:TPR repeat protein